ncbi:MAG: hypothetical protein JW717_02005 [Marinilabiliaceae bacterium]|nr:hypothetical protein [Marinilabiliaceae bacterium]
MPYRRLPNTDLARLRALQTANKKAATVSPFDLPFAQRYFLELQAFLPQFKQTIDQYNFSKNRQAQVGKLLLEQFRSARLYLSHFIQVFNFCIQRNELKPEARTFLGLNVNEKSIPDLGTEQQLIEWGDNVIKGEEKRMASGGTRIYNPSIAIVKVKYEQFFESYNSHKNLQITTQKHHEKVAEMRRKADQLILNIWNDVESKYEDLPSEKRRIKCTEFGIIYFLRKHEREEIANSKS